MMDVMTDDSELWDKSQNKADIEVLLVEDDPDDVILMTRSLRTSDFDISLKVAENGLEALRVLRSEYPTKNADLPNLVLARSQHADHEPDASFLRNCERTRRWIQSPSLS